MAKNIKAKLNRDLQALLPPLSTTEYDALRADIKANGVRVPIDVDEDGNILDGMHRFRIDKNAPTNVVSGLSWPEKLAFTLRANFARRNLSPDQRREVLAESKKTAQMLRATDAKHWTQKRVAELLGVAQNTVSKWFATNITSDKGCTPDARVVVPRETRPEIVKELDAGKTQAQVAADYGVSRQAIGKIATTQRKQAERKHNLKSMRWPDGKYRVIYADPPWQYNDQRTGTAESGGAVGQYETMSLDNICRMKVADLRTKDCVLFLWATSPLLPDALRVIDAWGFKYKASFVWDKQQGYNGNYNDVCHEFLLVATRGSCTPDATKLNKSIVSCKRGKHSAKPDAFREMIDAMYPHGPRIELFARTAAKGWDRWGNEA